MAKQEFEWPDIDWQVVVKKHQAKVRAYMQEKGIDHLILNEPDLIHSLIGMPTMKFYDAFAALRFLVDENFKGVFFNPFIGTPEAEFSSKGVEGIEKSISVGQDALHMNLQSEVLVQQLGDRKAKRVGVDRVFYDVHYEVQRRLPDIEFVPILWDLRKMREIKFPEEIAEMEVAAKICARGHEICMQEAYPGVTDGWLAGRFCDYILSQNAFYPNNLYQLKGPSFETWGILGRTFEYGDNNVIDFGLYSPHGLIADMGRTMWVGTPDPKFMDQTVRHAEATRDVGHNVLKPGMDKVEIAEAYKSAYRKVGLDDHLHMLGHNCGYRVNEYPSLDVSPIGMEWGEEAILKEGQIMMLEPALVTENGSDKAAMLMAEDIWVVEANGLRMLSPNCGFMGRDY